MDKGYDSESLHMFVRKRLDCIIVIPLVLRSRFPRLSLHGIILYQMRKAFEEDRDLRDLHRQRPQVKTSNNMVETLSNSHSLSRFAKTRVVVGLASHSP